jgi:hypothetical protein
MLKRYATGNDFASSRLFRCFFLQKEFIGPARKKTVCLSSVGAFGGTAFLCCRRSQSGVYFLAPNGIVIRTNSKFYGIPK